VVNAASASIPASLYDADPGCDVQTAPLPGCGGEDIVIADQGTWEYFWSRHKPWLAVPVVDFNEKVVVAMFLGWRRTSGYGETVSCVRYYEDNVTGELHHVQVEVYDVRPHSNCYVLPQYTNPYSIISVDRPVSLLGEPNVNVVHTSYTFQCGGNNCQCGLCGADCCFCP